ncbi:metallophosphoesterase [Rhizobium sp. L1K21]|uniref:metallophosphoesterase family protein n=1 Tax=Rhizobium sp. L1K21 TaxID=2954933 RepID=UPI002093673B|nr:metallophosphoesterase [Rhizobium sp. L1K21]MCO6185415.1 metallophosphoesterase [Rhizobium sp. L1K21]
MFKLAHISDVHLGPLPAITMRELMSKRITGYVNWQRNRKKHLFGDTLTRLIEHIRAQAPDHLAITGDLVNLAARTEIDKAQMWLENLGDPQEISVVPGNHDAYVPRALSRSLKAWRPFLTADGAPLSETPQFPYLRVRGPVALIGCSTAHATPPFSANGTFGPNQAERTRQLLKEAGERGLFRVVLIHHPPVRGAASNYKRMTGIRRFGKMLREVGAELVLHGHTHLNTVYHLEGRDGPVPVVGIASASQGQGGRKPPAGYNLFSISGEAGNWQLTRERFAMEGDDGAFILAQSDKL